MTGGQLWATSDLHVGYADNRAIVAGDLHPSSPGDWLIVAGDVAEKEEGQKNEPRIKANTT